MIEHLVMIKFKEDATAAQTDAVISALRGLASVVPGVETLTCGRNFSSRGEGYQVGLFVRFADRAALDAYGVHPAHVEVVQTLIKPIMTAIIVSDFEA